MRESLARIGKTTFIYSFGQVLSKMITLLLLPFYTQILSPTDYGIIGTLALLPLLFSGLFSLGFGVSISRSYWAEEGQSKRDSVIWTSFFFLLVHSAWLIIVASYFSESLSLVLVGNRESSLLVMMTLIGMGLSTIANPFQLYLNMKEEAKQVVAISVINLIISLLITIYLVLILKRGITGVIEAGLISQALSFCTYFIVVARRLHFSVTFSFLPDMLRVGCPYIFALGGYVVMQYTDRYMIQYFNGMDEVGLYYLGVNVGMVMSLAVAGFSSAWPAFFNSYIYKTEEAKIVFGKVMSLYLAIALFLCAGFFLFSYSVLYYFTNIRFHSSYTVVGLIALSQVLWGAYIITLPGVIFAKRTIFEVLMVGCAGLLNVLLNFMFIPLFQKEGAAFATSFSFLVLVLLSMSINLRYLKVQYEWRRLGALVGGFSIVMLSSSYFFANIWIMGLVFLSFGGYIGLYILSADERLWLLQALGGKRRADIVQAVGGK